jgi:hypothetical protein
MWLEVFATSISAFPPSMSLPEKKTTGATNGLTLDEILSKDVELKVDGELNEDDAIEEDDAAHVPKEGYCIECEGSLPFLARILRVIVNLFYI